MVYDTANTRPSMKLTKTQQVTTSFFSNVCWTEYDWKAAAIIYKRVVLNIKRTLQERQVRGNEKKKKRERERKKETPWQQHLEICTSMFFALKSGASVERNENIMSAVQASTTPRWGWVEAVSWLVSTGLRNGTLNGTPLPCSLLRRTFPTNRTSWISSGATLSTQDVASTQYIGPNLKANAIGIK